MLGLHSTVPAQHLRTAGYDLDNLDRDISDLSDLSDLDSDLSDLSGLSDLDRDLSDLSCEEIGWQ